MSEPTSSSADPIRLNVSVDAELHRDLRRIAAETGEKFTQLVPRLLRLAIKAEKERLEIT